MRTLTICIVLAAFIITACQNKSADHDHQATETPVVADTTKKSIPKEEHANIGEAHAMLKYHAPAVRGRMIWGGLVQFDEVWVTGAHSATSFEINKSIRIGGKEIPAGKYAFFTIPGKDKWIVILNSNWEQHLADEYDAKDDVVRYEVVPEVTENLQERLRYYLGETDGGGQITFRWEKIKIAVPFQILK